MVFPSAGLVVGQEENLPSAGLVKSITFLLEVQGTVFLFGIMGGRI